MTNKEKDCIDCKHYYTDYDCREFCEGRDMFEPNKKIKKMTNEEAIGMMKAKLECMTREVSGVDQDCNAKRCDDCDLCYAQGNIGQQKEWLKLAIEALEKGIYGIGE